MGFRLLDGLTTKSTPDSRASIKEQLMATQMENLQAQIVRLTADYGRDDPIVKALQQQLDGYKSMAVNREQNFRVGTVPRNSATSEQNSQLSLMSKVDEALSRMRSASPESTSASNPEPT